ncbi:cell wall hydrolase/autolysin [Desulfurispirillum indicum S5]|uniref:N-acetylmuramoyl-L-alanine amidase n=1 Tax=Desulfurispirillum indicum (strain ATCC BAA-1389 / DSM 22839 / S5) TaxID=653733 RepID=E6W3Q3_DESIS|nr:N-acetylmuramoyl-L-alanine amidase [Desulfurispirillum indicum]ADU66934.1 cell wall hydrolase/autolysin [Desulfurispirillum indicum S5]
MFRRMGFLLVPLLLCMLLSAPLLGNEYNEDYFFGVKSDYERLLRNESTQFRSAWLKVIEGFELFYLNRPDSPLAPEAMYNAGDAYFRLYRLSSKDYDLEQSLSTFRTLPRRYADSEKAPDAAFQAGRIYEEEKNDILLAARLYEQLIERYPRSQAAVDALQRLDAMGDIVRSPANVSTRRPSATRSTVPTLEDPAVVKPTQVAATNPVPSPAASEEVELIKVDTFSNAEYTRAVLRFNGFDGDISLKKHWLREDRNLGMPPRLFVDLFNVRKSEKLENLELDNTQLQGIRMAQYDRETVRVVFDINSVSDFKVFVLQNPVRVVVDLISEPEPDPMAVTRNLLVAAKTPPPVAQSIQAPAAPPAAGSRGGEVLLAERSKLPASDEPEPLQLASLEPRAISLAKQLGLGVNTVVIDAGHGGRDPGAVGFNGLLEKDVVLDIALKTAAYLRRNSDLTVHLTRETDKFLPLEARTAIANTKRADLFVSIHTNAFRDPNVHGLETYYLNITSDPRAMEVAARENAISQKSVSDLQNILNDLMLNTKINESAILAQVVHNDMFHGIRRHHPQARNAGIKKAPFYVLIGAQMPSILIETGFITNPREGTLLAQESYRQALAENIAKGIIRYAENH